MHRTLAKRASKYLRCGKRPCKFCSMICHRCLRCLRFEEDTKCEECEKRRRQRADDAIDIREGGDRGHQWRCAVCRSSLSGGDSPATKESLLSLINCITEKFELVNKIQLPKLNSDILHLKTITDYIVKQNEDILQKVAELERKGSERSHPVHACRSRGSWKTQQQNKPVNKCDKDDKDVPSVNGFPDKNVRYRTRRRSYALHKVFLLLNRRERNHHKSPRRKF